jgi:hypothetical protein
MGHASILTTAQQSGPTAPTHRWLLPAHELVLLAPLTKPEEFFDKLRDRPLTLEPCLGDLSGP